MISHIFKKHPPKTIILEALKHLFGYYWDWKKLIKLTFITQVITFIALVWIFCSWGIIYLLNKSLSGELSSNTEWSKLNASKIFLGDYGAFIDQSNINQSNINQSILLKFAAYVALNKAMVWSFILIILVFLVKLLMFFSISFKSTKEIPLNILAFNVGFLLLPIFSYRKMKKLDVPSTPQKINFTNIFNDFMSLQNFPKIKNKQSLLKTKNLSFNYETQWFFGKWIHNIHKKYLSNFLNLNCQCKAQDALQDINLSINSSCFTSILGCNGSSKSTLLKSIINLFEDYSGEISWMDKNLKKISHKSFYKNVAYIAQETNIQNEITVYDYVACGLFPSFSFFRFSYPKDDPTILENLKKMGILQYKDKNINSLSGGEKQKAILARVLTQKTKVIILDEPTTYLDIKNQYLILSILKKLQLEENKTIITILHDIKQAEQFSDEVIILDNGKIYASGKTKEVITKENIEKVFGISWY